MNEYFDRVSLFYVDLSKIFEMSLFIHKRGILYSFLIIEGGRENHDQIQPSM